MRLLQDNATVDFSLPECAEWLNGVGPQEHFDIMDKTLYNCVKYGLKRAFLG
jgi:hypothetical protein